MLCFICNVWIDEAGSEDGEELVPFKGCRHLMHIACYLAYCDAKGWEPDGQRVCPTCLNTFDEDFSCGLGPPKGAPNTLPLLASFEPPPPPPQHDCIVVAHRTSLHL